MKSTAEHQNEKVQKTGSFFRGYSSTLHRFKAPAIQPKLTINEPNDQYEQEADAMAEKVMAIPGNDPIAPLPIQRKCNACEEKDRVQTMPSMMRSGNGHVSGTEALASQLNESKGKGSELPADVNKQMSGAFGTDFSSVRVHTGSDSVKMNNGIQAKAFTHGSDIYFNKGQYRPGTAGGKKLLAHELTHVVQQGNAKGKIQREFDWKRGGIGALIGGIGGALVGGLIGGAIGSSIGGAEIGNYFGAGMGIGAAVGGLAGLLIGGLTGDSPESQALLESDAGNSEILAVLRDVSTGEVDQETARQVMEVLNQLTENRMRLIVADLIRGGHYVGFRENVINPVQDDFQGLVNRIEMLHGEFNDPTQNTQNATPDEQQQVSDILNQGMNVDASGQVLAFVDTVNGRTFEEDVKDTLEREITELTPRAARRDVLPRFGWSRYEEMANEAKERTDDLYGHYRTGDVLTSTGSTPNLLDVRDQSYGLGDLIHFANYLVTGHNAIDPVYPGDTILNKHNADTNRSVENNILSQAIADWIAVSGNQDRILLVRRNWSGTQAGGVISIQRWRRNNVRANRLQFWDTFQTMIHEYLHKVTHDDYSDRARTLGRRREQIFTEGGTSYFDRNVWNTIWPNEIRTNPELREKVEGGQYEYDNSLIPPWNGYDQVAQFEQIVQLVGEENARAAYFRGEVEKIGMP